LKTIEDLIKMEKEGILEGLFRDIPEEIYHDPRCPGFSRSDLIQVNRSFEHYLCSKENKESSPAQEFGTAFHSLILEPELFDENNYSEDEIPKMEVLKFGRTKAEQLKKEQWENDIYKPWMDQVLEPWFKKNMHKKMWKSKDWENLHKMKEAFYKNEICRKLIKSSEKELTIFWKDPSTGILLKARPDLFSVQFNCIVDLKSTQDASENAFRRTVKMYEYNFQAAFYLEAAHRTIGKFINDFIFIAIEKTPPYGLALYTLNELEIRMSKEKVGESIKKLDYYLKNQSGNMGYPTEIRVINL